MNKLSVENKSRFEELKIEQSKTQVYKRPLAHSHLHTAKFKEVEMPKMAI